MEKTELNEELLFAVEEDRAGDLKELVAQGADLNQKSPSASLTLLHRAVSYGSVQSVPVLIELGADVNAQNNCGDTPLNKLASIKGSDPAIAHALIKGGADIDRVENIYGRTPLHTAACNGRGDLVQLLIEAGADQTITDKQGMTAEEAMHQRPFVSQDRTVDAQREFDAHRARVQAEQLQEATVASWSPGDLSGDHLIPKAQGDHQAPVQRQSRRL